MKTRSTRRPQKTPQRLRSSQIWSSTRRTGTAFLETSTRQERASRHVERCTTKINDDPIRVSPPRQTEPKDHLPQLLLISTKSASFDFHSSYGYGHDRRGTSELLAVTLDGKISVRSFGERTDIGGGPRVEKRLSEFELELLI